MPCPRCLLHCPLLAAPSLCCPVLAVVSSLPHPSLPHPSSLPRIPCPILDDPSSIPCPRFLLRCPVLAILSSRDPERRAVRSQFLLTLFCCEADAFALRIRTGFPGRNPPFKPSIFTSGMYVRIFWRFRAPEEVIFDTHASLLVFLPETTLSSLGSIQAFKPSPFASGARSCKQTRGIHVVIYIIDQRPEERLEG
jgi:hypothetical protein